MSASAEAIARIDAARLAALVEVDGALVTCEHRGPGCPWSVGPASVADRTAAGWARSHACGHCAAPLVVVARSDYDGPRAVVRR